MFVHIHFVQIKNAVAAEKKKIGGRAYISVEELKTWANQHSNIPDDEAECFVVQSKVVTETSAPDIQKYVRNAVHFNCLLTSKRLLENALHGGLLHADATYKINYCGYPLLVFGVTDRRKAFHPIAFGMTDTENGGDYAFFFKAIKDGALRVHNRVVDFTASMTDAAMAPQNGFNEVFHGKNLTCNYHAMTSAKMKLPGTENASALQKDIESLQILSNEAAFDLGWKLYEKKWGKREASFVVYMADNWIKRNKNWFEGASTSNPSTNNALESFNGKIKSNFLKRQRPLLGAFKEAIEKMVNGLSVEYRGGKKVYVADVELQKEDWRKAADWTNSVIEEKRVDCVKYFTRSEDKKKVTKSDVTAYKSTKTADFDTFIRQQLAVNVVTVVPNGDYVKTTTCTCTEFFKNYMCKHIVGMGIRLHRLEMPEQFIRVETKKRGPGRPKKAASALAKD